MKSYIKIKVVILNRLAKSFVPGADLTLHRDAKYLHAAAANKRFFKQHLEKFVADNNLDQNKAAYLRLLLGQSQAGDFDLANCLGVMQKLKIRLDWFGKYRKSFAENVRPILKEEESDAK